MGKGDEYEWSASMRSPYGRTGASQSVRQVVSMSYAMYHAMIYGDTLCLLHSCLVFGAQASYPPWSSIPHSNKNPGTVTATVIWAVTVDDIIASMSFESSKMHQNGRGDLTSKSNRKCIPDRQRILKYFWILPSVPLGFHSVVRFFLVFLVFSDPLSSTFLFFKLVSIRYFFFLIFFVRIWNISGKHSILHETLNLYKSVYSIFFRGRNTRIQLQYVRQQ